MARRTLLLGALGLSTSVIAARLGVDTDRRTIAGHGLTYRLQAGVPWDVPDIDPGTSASGSFVSAERGGVRTGWTIGYPPGLYGATLPVLVVLHGTGGDHTAAFTELHLDRFLAAAIAQGTVPFAIASVDGGHRGYWHPRRGRDAAGMVIDEFLPILAGQGLLTRRIGLLGWSMGGYGALYLATVLGRTRVAAVAAESPAIWPTFAEGVPGAFDDEADFAAHSIFGRERLLAGIPLRIDCGASDRFAPAARDLRAALSPRPAGGITPGGHDVEYWRGQAPAQLAFVGHRLAEDSRGTAMTALNTRSDTSG